MKRNCPTTQILIAQDDANGLGESSVFQMNRLLDIKNFGCSGVVRLEGISGDASLTWNSSQGLKRNSTSDFLAGLLSHRDS
jgi:hypothetical protein